ncbi:MAG: thioredoxin family protein [Bryobacterales bacterium]|nr:thioredoxin family protein [Bryobacterales bacterium]
MKTLRKSFPALLTAVAATIAASAPHALAQIYDPVQWRLELESDEATPGSKVLARLTAVIDETWHIYSSTTPEGIPLDVAVSESDAIAGWRAYQPEPEIVFDPNFQSEVEWYSDEPVFLIELDLAPEASGQLDVEVNVRYGACDPRQCLPPKRKSASASLMVAQDAAAAAFAIPGGYQPAVRNVRGRPPGGSPSPESRPAQSPREFGSSDTGLFTFSLLALGFGFAAILTPCVFPMIPIYIGSFMGDGQRSWGSVVRQASTFCLGVVILFTAIGGALSAFLGPFGLSQIGSNAWVNLMIFAVMSAFALSMLGAFELSVPSSWTTGASARSVGTGTVATLVLSLVFTLASFACTGPFVGSLLAGSVSQGGAAFPVVGMSMFSVGLSAPFFVLSLFPALMNGLPRSGVWLAVSKRAAGIVILAIALKYLSNADKVLGWNVLSREAFLALWVALGTSGALYLWGVLRLEEDGPSGKVGLVRLGIGLAFLAFSISLVPGMLGGRLGELEAFVPEPTGRGIAGDGGTGLAWAKDDYEGSAARAQAEGKPLLVSFTGYSCSNCKWMKANMFTEPEISELAQAMVLVELYTDGYDDASERHQDMQVDRFQSSSIPFYALIRPDGSVAAVFSGQTRNVEEFRSFLLSAS